MKFYIPQYIVLLLLFACNITKTLEIQTDAQAYDYCIKNNKTFIALVWPVAQGKDTELNKLLNSYGRVHYKNNLPLLLIKHIIF
ncbi:hypothetical protein H0X48_03650 [Candidatus Dependentiae bacterium]|nr:hypothetical protein [Candidatus Dependentiae bacterium]